MGSFCSEPQRINVKSAEFETFKHNYSRYSPWGLLKFLGIMKRNQLSFQDYFEGKHMLLSILTCSLYGVHFSSRVVLSFFSAEVCLIGNGRAFLHKKEYQQYLICISQRLEQKSLFINYFI